MKIKASLPKGLRDFLPKDVLKRQFIIQTIKEVFELYGFQGIETPVMENLETLTGKYGEEGDQLLFKVLNNGDYFEKIPNTISSEDTENIFKWLNRFIQKVEQSSNQGGFINVFDNYIYLLDNISISDIKVKDYVIDFTRIKKLEIKVIIKEVRSKKSTENAILDAFFHFQNCLIDLFNELLKGIEEDLKIKSIEKFDSRELVKFISKRGLRYDLTVPLARYVVQNQNDLTFPFKRYHIAPVWRADRPQKGRYQEFYQCDVDVIGSASLYNDVELIQIYSSVFEKLNMDVEIQYNNRKVLLAFMQALGLKDKETQGISILDKLDKIGLEKVTNELKELGLNATQLDLFQKVISSNDVSLIPESDLLTEGKKEVDFIQKFQVPSSQFKISLARGLDYYTGSIFEVLTKEYEIGSIGGGGRYDNLTEMFGKKDLTGVGISFGLERIYDVMEALNKFPENLNISSQLLFVNFSADNQPYSFTALNKVRQAGIAAEMYPDTAKFKNQMKYANDKNIPFVAIVGDNEMKDNVFMLKNMDTGEQEALDLESLIQKIAKH